ncbi:MAG: GNAT family N-acetyltransferase [Gemmataceae bacterium]|nr:GNAT family N-acetyltransferase [Gemmataceae bacterium]
MAEIVCLHAKDEVESFCLQNPYLHIYAIGDLDDFFWPNTVWYALRDHGRVRQLVLLYTGCSMPTILAYAEQPVELMRDLLRGLLPYLPKRFYAHLTQSAADVLAADYRMVTHGNYHKMALSGRQSLAAVDASLAEALSVSDLQDVQALYASSYPGNFFVPRMLETGFYFGVRRGAELLSVAGVHVYSRKYKVAALGNITTRPDVRGQGLATTATARLCQELVRDGIEHIGLNVNADNKSTVACYQKLGFVRIADYGEYTVSPL